MLQSKRRRNLGSNSRCQISRWMDVSVRQKRRKQMQAEKLLTQLQFPLEGGVGKRERMGNSIRNRVVSTRLVTQFRDVELLNWSNHSSRRHLETLAFEEVRASTTIHKPKPYDSTVFVLHGLLGSGRNWRSFARNLSSFLSAHSSNEWRLVLVDLRNHGNSAGVRGLHPPNDLDNAAADLAHLVKSQGWDWPDVVIGHSLGGKVALQYAQSGATGDYGRSIALPKQLWVLDSVPGVVNPEESSGEVERVLETLQSIPSPVPSRKWLVEHMMELGFSKSLSEWLGTNLRKSNDHETWTFNIEGAVQMFNSYREKDYWPLLEHPPNGMEISIVQAEKSDRWDPHVIQRLQSLSRIDRDGSEGKFSLHVLPKAGHWVHVDNPKGLLEIVGPQIASLK